MSEPSVRESIGLDAASEGDPKGVRQFLSFLQQEFGLMAFMSGLPEPVAQRCAHLLDELKRANEFVDGFIAASKPEPNKQDQ